MERGEPWKTKFKSKEGKRRLISEQGTFRHQNVPSQMSKNGLSGVTSLHSAEDRTVTLRSDL